MASSTGNREPEAGRRTAGYNVAVAPERPDYKSHPLWEQAMRLAQAAYGLARELSRERLDEALSLRKAAVSVPAHVAGALEAGEPAARNAETAGARAALSEVAARADRLLPSGTAADLSRRARELERMVALELTNFGDSPLQ